MKFGKNNSFLMALFLILFALTQFSRDMFCFVKQEEIALELDFSAHDLFLATTPVLEAGLLKQGDLVFFGKVDAIKHSICMDEVIAYSNCGESSKVVEGLAQKIAKNVASPAFLEGCCGKSFEQICHSQYCASGTHKGKFVFFGSLEQAGAISMGAGESGSLQIVAEGEDADLIDISSINSTIKVDLLYAKSKNFVGEIVYDADACYMRRRVAQKLDKVQGELEKEGLGLKITDAYRPCNVQEILWDRCPIEGLVASPIKGSKHSRGAAVDVTLISLADGRELDMGCPIDEMTERAFRTWAKGISFQAYENRKKLESIMVSHGFIPLPSKWWHFDDDEWQKYSLCGTPISVLVGRDRGRQGIKN